MSDLISRSALIKVLKDRATNEAIMGYMTAYDVTNSIIDEVEEHPAAFDADKVIFELEKELSLADKEKERCTDENHLQFDSVKGYVRGISTAIEIVKQGGVDVANDATTKNDDVCEWKHFRNDKSPYRPSCSQYMKSKFEAFKIGDYCQFCGKKIKVVG